MKSLNLLPTYLLFTIVTTWCDAKEVAATRDIKLDLDDDDEVVIKRAEPETRILTNDPTLNAGIGGFIVGGGVALLAGHLIREHEENQKRKKCHYRAKRDDAMARFLGFNKNKNDDYYCPPEPSYHRPQHQSNSYRPPHSTSASYRPPHSTSASYRPPHSTSSSYRPPHQSYQSGSNYRPPHRDDQYRPSSHGTYRPPHRDDYRPPHRDDYRPSYHDRDEYRDRPRPLRPSSSSSYNNHRDDYRDHDDNYRRPASGYRDDHRDRDRDRDRYRDDLRDRDRYRDDHRHRDRDQRPPRFDEKDDARPLYNVNKRPLYSAKPSGSTSDRYRDDHDDYRSNRGSSDFQPRTNLRALDAVTATDAEEKDNEKRSESPEAKRSDRVRFED